MRLIHAVRELNAEGGEQIETVALYTDAERTAIFVREADLAYPLGPASARPYLDHKVLERALRETGADAAWVGWGFVAEDPAFAELCDQLGVTFIGPSAEAMRKLGDKIGSKLIAEEVGVPVAPWSRGAVDSLEEAMAASKSIGYPLMLKATAGGGGRGIRVITSEDDLVDAYERTRDEAAARVRQRRGLPRAAGHRRPARRGPGHRRRAGHRLGARGARLLDPAPQPEGHRGVGLAGPQRRAGRRSSRSRPSGSRSRSATAAPAPSSSSTTRGERTFAFLEVNTRLQVEHPITELTTDVDLVKAQIHVASGGRLEGDPPARERPRRRGPAQRRGPRPRLRARPGPDRAAGAAGRPGHPGRHRRQRGRHHPRRLRLDDRQDHRLRPRPATRRWPGCAGRSPRRR